jgi:hypothetical protein
MSQNVSRETQILFDKERARALNLLKTDLPTFASHCLRIRDKQGRIMPLNFNREQLYAHAMCEDQLKRTGMVRKVILKGRQQGMSTYAAARFFHKTLLQPGAATFILSHEGKSTGVLFDIVKRYYDRLPAELVPMRPELGASNKNQLKFLGTDSEYTVGTAGNEDIGRSMTLKHLHMSEVAFYDRTDQLETGLMQAVADMPDTEVLMESTANGLGNMFHDRAMKAMAGIGSYEMIFIPWFWNEGYRRPPPEGFTPDDSEQRLMKQFNLELDQIYWRRLKIENTKGGLWTFQQEYPCTADEAFLMSGESFFSKECVVNARRCKAESPGDPIIAGLDCARGNDRSVFVVRQGRKILHYECHKDLRAEGLQPTQQLIAHSMRIIDTFNVDKMFIDMGSGYGVVDGLRSYPEYQKIVIGIAFQQKVMDEVRFLNKRAEMYGLARDWLEEGNVSIPDTEEFCIDLLLTGKERETPTKRMFLPPKTEIKTKHKVSPDITDGFVLTFAFPVPRTREGIGNRSTRRRTTTHQSALETINRINRNSSPSTSVAINVDL